MKYTKKTFIVWAVFFSLIALAVYITNSPFPLLAILVTPTIYEHDHSNKNDKCQN